MTAQDPLWVNIDLSELTPSFLADGDIFPSETLM
jgi:hypothetical protein